MGIVRVVSDVVLIRWRRADSMRHSNRRASLPDVRHKGQNTCRLQPLQPEPRSNFQMGSAVIGAPQQQTARLQQQAAARPSGPSRFVQQKRASWNVATCEETTAMLKRIQTRGAAVRNLKMSAIDFTKTHSQIRSITHVMSELRDQTIHLVTALEHYQQVKGCAFTMHCGGRPYTEDLLGELSWLDTLPIRAWLGISGHGNPFLLPPGLAGKPLVSRAPLAADAKPGCYTPILQPATLARITSALRYLRTQMREVRSSGWSVPERAAIRGTGKISWADDVFGCAGALGDREERCCLIVQEERCHAVDVIQRQWRAHKKQLAAVKLQRQWRIYRRERHKQQAATILQRHWRVCNLGRQQRHKQQAAATILQRHWRVCNFGRQQQYKQQAAATILQRHWRTHSVSQAQLTLDSTLSRSAVQHSSAPSDKLKIATSALDLQLRPSGEPAELAFAITSPLINVVCSPMMNWSSNHGDARLGNLQ